MPESTLQMFAELFPSVVVGGEVVPRPPGPGQHLVLRLQEAYLAIAAGRFELLAEMLAPEAEFEIIGPAGLPFICFAKGPAEIVAATRTNFGLVTDQRPALELVIAQDDAVVVSGRETGRYQTGEPYAYHWIHFFTFRDARITNIREMLVALP